MSKQHRLHLFDGEVYKAKQDAGSDIHIILATHSYKKLVSSAYDWSTL